ncbi:uncharacterized protein LOC141914913 [Tubulanus polymorphus]|uniref:uncharacterized protein LOC141914913 n=1 Tax=Tubulanus polymorphus TaxID=672921 RepID=UPI003DA29005
MTMYTTRIQRYRLSQIDEESDVSVLDFNGMEEEFQNFNLIDKEHTAQLKDGATSPIYCSTDELVVSAPPQNDVDETTTKEAVKKIADKYDSLERMQSHINRNAIMQQDMDGDGHRADEADRSVVPVVDVFESVPRPEQITDGDIAQVEMFYRSHQSTVTVCQALTNLYFGQAKSDMSGDNWELFRTGIPVVILDSGQGRRRRMLHIVLAEKGTGFTLWRDHIDHLSCYKMVQPNFHTVFMSNDHTRLAGLSFDDAVAANDFLNTIQTLTSDPSDEMLSTGRKKKEKPKKSKGKFKAPKKTDISQPCCFVHVTKLENSENFGSVQASSRPRPPSVIQQLGSNNGVTAVPTDQE